MTEKSVETGEDKVSFSLFISNIASLFLSSFPWIVIFLLLFKYFFFFSRSFQEIKMFPNMTTQIRIMKGKESFLNVLLVVIHLKYFTGNLNLS